MSDAGLEHFRGCKDLRHVELRNLSSTRFSTSGFPGCKDLRHVELRNTPVTDDGASFLAELRGPGPLVLGGTKVSGEIVAALKRARPRCWIAWNHDTVMPPRPTERAGAEVVLALGGTIRDNSDTRDLRPVIVLGERSLLFSVQLRDNPKVTDASLAAIAGCWHVKYVDLSGTATGDAGLAAFKNCRPILTLDLGRTRVTSVGLAALGGLADLIHARPNDTGIDDVGLARLRDCAWLVYLDLRKTQVAAAAVAAFAAARPRCKIEWDGSTVEPNR